MPVSLPLQIPVLIPGSLAALFCLVLIPAALILELHPADDIPGDGPWVSKLTRYLFFAPPLSYFLPDVAAVKGCLLSYLGFAQIIFQSFLKLLYKFTSCHKDLLILQRSDHRRTASAMPPYPRSSPAHPPARGALP